MLKTLEKSVGKGNYDFILQAGPDMDSGLGGRLKGGLGPGQ
ncbi:MAG: hypothetical protein WA885_09840 [Phormidesmis sp.]